MWCDMFEMQNVGISFSNLAISAAPKKCPVTSNMSPLCQVRANIGRKTTATHQVIREQRWDNVKDEWKMSLLLISVLCENGLFEIIVWSWMISMGTHKFDVMCLLLKYVWYESGLFEFCQKFCTNCMVVHKYQTPITLLARFLPLWSNFSHMQKHLNI